ncbi:hypothetical protein MP631_18605 [Xanthomonas phaseoli pv. phaseoli]|nr:hypothetical protein MP631_18605 [Xanthomonas phaseoli pv. phaseoli]
MSNFLLYKTSSPALQKAQEALSTGTIGLALKGKHKTIKEAFAVDKLTLEEISNSSGDPLQRNLGFMAGKVRRR